ncbi:hypothetical protein B0P06_001376 [Clostridium saccharoperbutylacetonicum]|uniref:Putative tail fiber protein n=1 Tax=Clostridium saccharoperbutylacetonicum N1-4(HMT) TaxID=931276 RepID=M1MI28_9CLOT|nr:phage tail protein [Clostridium saccharoperbutylacetonicum]AGF54551.1 putative tail fiber protein [Clostridium saccharoperbutylacetonicum N1-4(HMT)]NRT58929.1 hypothetical protein [Clostridium saccharoperbutylacetonicum]NSB28117.1 hypothetical protein [Clostridium saccharoperbutylacetonicum]NSB41605.1 hypothetical protein [Clostridium saccharoperbutylacetonicum]
MSENFYTILTATGKAKLANSAVLGSKVNFKTLKVGDGNGAYYEPTESQTSLVREVWSGNVSSISVDENNPNWIVAETLIPATIGGFFIREAGIFDEDGDLIAISKLSETYKPVVSEGSIKDLCIKIVLEVSNVASVTLKIDPTVIVATRKDIDVLQAKMDASNAETSEEIKELDSKLSEQISELANEISNKNVITPAVGYGMNNVIKNVGETSVSPKFTIQGKTVVNLLGKDGNCEDLSKWYSSGVTRVLDVSNKVFGNNGIKIIENSANSNCAISLDVTPFIDKTKYYCLSGYLKNGNIDSNFYIQISDNVSYAINSVDVTDSTKFNRVFLKYDASKIAPTSTNRYAYVGVRGTTVGQYGYLDGIMLEEITKEQYSDPNFQPSPYVDSYTCLQNPYIEVRHDNLVRNGNGEEGTAWWLPINSGATLSLLNSKLTLTTTSTYLWVRQPINVKPNTDYYLAGNVSGNVNLVIAKGDLTGNILINNGTFNSGNNSVINVVINNNNIGTGTADSIMLVEGTTAPISYKSCRIERCVVEGKFADGDSLVLENGEVTGQINWKHKSLIGKDYDWELQGDYTGYKCLDIRTPIASDRINKGINTNYSDYVITKYNGAIIRNINASACIDSGWIGLGDQIGVCVADSESGWTESINPNNDEVKAFMNGWKAIWNNGTRYIAWASIIDNSLPSVMSQSTTTATGTSTTSLPVADGTKFSVGAICVFHPSGYYQVVNVSSISGNNLTVSNPVSFNNGAVVGSISDNGTTNVSVLTYCKNNVAPNYEGYQLHYKLATPEPLTDVNANIHGDIPKLDVGDNYLLLDSGSVLNEVANPQSHNASDYQYKINSNYYDGKTASYLKNKTEIINGIFRNGLWDSMKWLIKSQYEYSAYGNCGAYITATNFDTNATYTVDYKILSTIAPQIGSFIFNYEQNIVSAINNLEDQIDNRQAHDSILDTLVDLSIYEKKVNCSLFNRASKCSNLPIIEYIVQFTPKKTVPIISLLNIGTSYCDGTSGYVIPLSDVKFTVYILDKSTIKVTSAYTGNNTTIQNNLYNYGGWIVFDITADCRGRI